MPGKSTDDLRQELMSDSGIDAYIKENEALFTESNITVLLNALINDSPVSKAVLAKRSDMSEVYLYQVLSGRRTPSRDRLICLCVGLGLSAQQAQQLLKQTSYGELYPKLKREAIILYGLAHGLSLPQINDKLYAENEKTLS